MENKRSMTEGRLFKNIIAYTIPVILTGVLQLLFNTADLIVVGRFCGSDSVGAVGATGALTRLLVSFFTGLSVGAGVITAQSVGAGDEESTHRAVHTAIPLAFFGGIALALLGVVFSEQLLRLMHTPEDIIGLAATYMRIYFGGITATLVYNFGTSILRAVGDTKRPLIFLTISGVLNVILNIIFVTAFDMDVAGVALATSLSQTVAAVLVVITLMRRRDVCRLTLSKMHIYREKLVTMLRIGLPAGTQSSLFAISNIIIQSSINTFGAAAVAGNSAAESLENIVEIALIGFYHSGLNFVGQNVGAKKYDRIGKITRICLLSTAVLGLVMGVTMTVFGRQLLEIYLKDAQEEIAFGIMRMQYICAPFFMNGLMDTMTGIIRGMGKSTVPMVITVLGVCVFRIVWIYTAFAALSTLEVLFLSYFISWTATFLAQFAAYIIIKRKLIREAA